ncbi:MULTISPECIES: DNA polymerase III subunit delta [Thermodesulfobacterium]|jgi:DNA polymerase-3 subunit delta|nr:hypothetical protein [Thermodesulfobacterium sp.]KUJ97464.1 MAG: DNA polymerase III delta [Thermodesulfobacterium sp. 37_54]KUK18881.1 MAG: DNA polymerase III delta [Thermodesulfobacterium commune]KUK37607.1 MAG: DNA polymerase III delta [Thermodesulfobacterium commune]MBZ4682172.1 hypothetical protein [Thermodesulfobacterium sp.]MDK2861194.1 polymerase subunit delta [Thermodesulfobacterium sp.]
MPVLTFSKVLELAKQKRIAPVYIFIGEPQLCKEKAKEIYNILQDKGSTIEVYNLNDKEDKKTFSKIKGYQEGLFGLRKVYLILGGENIELSKEEEIIKSLEKETSVFTWFIIAEKFEENRPLYQFALQKGAIVFFNFKKEEDFLETELILKLKETGKTMDRKTTELFLSLVGKDYHHFLNELDKLLLYTEERAVITEEDVWSVTIPLEEEVLFMVEESLFQSGPEKAYRIVAQLLDHKEEPHRILSYLYKSFKIFQILAEFLEKHPELKKEERFSQFSKKWEEIKTDPIVEIPKVLTERHPYRIFNLKKHLEKIKNLPQVFEELYKAELSLKRDFKNPYQVFKELFINLWQKTLQP